ncbi:hypothetical protein [Methylobacterium sp. WSM2598]|uniref:hypothetical protein n=1 Tax=Methylobacterium sp. WSM2598 TaxID=398261 RepID=UPI000364B9CA|nr:hypothetical protein [Methylobacterium sp. WSM2598]
MTRYRARPSFTVEIKRTRTSPAASSEAGEPKAPANTLWAGTGLIEEAAAATQSGRFDDAPLPAPAKTASSAQGSSAQTPSRRVLPSLIAPPEPPAPEPEPAPVEEEPVFRRPGRPATRKAVPAPKGPALKGPALKGPAQTGFVWPEDWPDEPPAAPAPAPEPAPPALAPVSLAALRAVGEAAPRPKRREGDLRVGERWKRRLPRYCR